MKSAMDILLPKIKEAEENQKKGLVCDNKLYIIQAMNEFADQFKSNKLFEFLYCDCIHESSYATISLHRTREGAEKAMNKHKEDERLKFEDGYKKTLMKEYMEDKELSDDSRKILIDSIGTFDKHKDWAINEIEVED